MNAINIKGQSEDRLQQICFLWHWNEYPDQRGLLFHVPNGGNRNAREGAKFKTMGVIPGVSDLIFLYDGVAHFIELKNEKGVQSKRQKNWEALVKAERFPYYIVRSLDSFQILIETIIKSEW